MQDIFQLEQRALKCNNEVLLLLENTDMEPKLLRLKIKFWENELDKVEKLINSYYEAINLLKEKE